ncbi:TraU family protein (plasmid) [Diaphorobacter sp. HDW4A]|jgi:conjugal transfer pilus assembly protein TraU|nr:TraU family protein [Diaphorobacter sp. HDW4A]
MRKLVKSILLACALMLCMGGAHAQDSKMMKLVCNSYSPLETMFKDVCWSGMFPFRLMGATFMSGKSGVPTDASNKIICACGGDLKEGKLPRLGFTLGFWAPSKIMDVTRQPFCLPSLGGIELPLGDMSFLNGGANMGRSDRHEAFANWALYTFPIIYMLRLIDDGACPADGMTEFDLLQASPMFPNWNDVLGRYTTFINPEMMLFTGVTSLFALPVDTAASTAGSPMNSLFWVAGGWGPVYPITGFYGNGNGRMIDPVGFTSLTAMRGVSLLHRLGMLNETIGNDNLCERHPRFIIRKDAYRWQFLAPSPETSGRAPEAGPPTQSSSQVTEVNPPSRFSSCTHSTGSSTAAWGMWRDVPATGEDHSYLLFQWTDCCFGITPD